MGTQEFCNIVTVNYLDTVDRFVSVILIKEHDTVYLVDIKFACGKLIYHKLGALPVGYDDDMDLIAGFAHPPYDKLLPEDPCQELKEEIQKEEGSHKDTGVDLDRLQGKEEQDDGCKLRYILEEDHIELCEMPSLQYPAVERYDKDKNDIYEQGIDIELGIVSRCVKIPREPQKVGGDK